MSRAVRAFVAGLRIVLLSPALVVGVTLAMLATAVPFGLMVGSRLQAALAEQQPVSAGRGDIDAEWWMEYREHASGLDATFTPTIIGFAAPLDNLSALVDASPRPWALAGPVALSVLVWAFLWGGILKRLSHGHRMGPTAFVSNGVRHLPQLLLISVAAVPVYLFVYATVHALLFGPVYGRLAALVSSERDAFLCRVALYAIFVAILAAIALVVDYARIHVVAAGSPGAIAGIRSGLRFVRAEAGAVAGLYIIAGLVLVAMLAVYGSSEIYGGTRLGGWRAVAIGQAYIVGRLALRLVLAASEVELYRKSKG